MRIGSLFSGIGGLELGLERAGVGHVVWQVEQDEYCRAVLAKHWPEAVRHEDVREVGCRNLAPVDVICGGFPCQDISYAGKGAGLAGERSGLWYEFARIVRELGPRFVVVENVTALLDRGMGDVLGTLADLGYDVSWSELSACAVGAPHMRSRVFALAYRPRLNGLPYCPVIRGEVSLGVRAWWDAEPGVVRVADGFSAAARRNRALGNAVVPQVAEVVGRVLLQIHQEIAGEEVA